MQVATGREESESMESMEIDRIDGELFSSNTKANPLTIRQTFSQLQMMIPCCTMPMQTAQPKVVCYAVTQIHDLFSDF